MTFGLCPPQLGDHADKLAGRDPLGLLVIFHFGRADGYFIAAMNNNTLRHNENRQRKHIRVHHRLSSLSFSLALVALV